MEYFNKIVCVTYDELLDSSDGEAVIKVGTLRSLLTRKVISYARKGFGMGCKALLDYSTIPTKYRQRYEEKYGDPVKLLKEATVKDRVKLDDKARVFFEEYTYELNGEKTSLSSRIKEEYILNASVLNELISLYNTQKGYANALGNTVNIWESVARSCEKMREQYGHTLPNSLARLKAKISEYKKDSYRCLVSKKLGNANTLKLTEEAGRQIIALKRSSVPVYTDSQIFTEFNRIAAEKGWKPLKSRSSLTAFLNRPDIEPLWWDAVHGELSAHQKYGRKNRTQMPTLRDALWYGDGTKLNLYYRGDDGKVYTTQVYEVIDAATEVLLGYHISDSEDYEAQYLAYRMAIQVSKHKPYEIVYDGQGGHSKLSAGNFFDKLVTHVHRRTAPYSGQSKSIESLFGRFQAQVLHKDWRFTGQNITATKESSRPNIERINANKDKLFTLEELKAEYLRMRNEWNEMPHPATGIPRIEMYRNSVNQETQAVTEYDMIDMFWFETDKPSTFTASGIEITIKKRKYAYEVYSAPGTPDHEWRRKNTGQRFKVKYDPYDMASVRLYRVDNAGELRFERIAEPYMVIHRARQDQQEGDLSFIHKEVEANIRDRIERQVAAREIEYEHGVAMEQQGLNRPKIKGLERDMEREIERRLKKYSKVPEELEMGRVTKMQSNMTFGEYELNQEPTVVDIRKVASKY